MPVRRSTVNWLSIAGGVSCLTALAIWLVVELTQGDLDRGDKLASIISMSIAVVTLPLTVFAIVVSLRQNQPARAVLTLGERLDEMAEALAISVRSQWEAEEQVRGIHDPFPLPARWTIAPEHLMDHWQNIHGDPVRREPIPLDGDGDHIADTFNRVPSGRLVVLGRAGAGKTVLTLRFALTLLAARTIPVPVIFYLGSWDPTANPLGGWLEDQLITTYPILAERDSSGATVAAQLLTTGRILPVLDGFDEISESLRVNAIDAINAGLRPGVRLLLTSRTDEYATAVHRGDVLTAAAVVRLEDLTATDVATYLPLTTRKTTVHSGRNKWDPILDHLNAGPSPLSKVLSTPLMVTLARAVFSETDADPTGLLGVSSANAIKDRLLAGFVPAVYSNTRYSPSKARRWLASLAIHLRRLDTYDLAWWQLVFAVPRIVIGLVAGIVLTLATWLVTGLPILLGVLPDEARAAWLVACLGAGPLAGALGGLVVGQLRGLHPSPVRMRLKIRGGVRPILRDLAHMMRSRRSVLWYVVWLSGGLLFGWAAQVISGSAIGIPFGLGAGLVIGVSTWLVAVSVRALGTWVDPRETVSPAELLRTDRSSALRKGLTFGVAACTVLWLVLWLVFEPATGLPFGTVYGHGVWVLNWFLMVAGGVLLWMLFVTVWGPWLIARFWLPLTGQSPWSIMAFLADAHRRGVLRQAGGVYQFRHARLRDHLATR